MKSCYNFKTSIDINIKLRPLSELGKRNMITSKKSMIMPC